MRSLKITAAIVAILGLTYLPKVLAQVRVPQPTDQRQPAAGQQTNSPRGGQPPSGQQPIGQQPMGQQPMGQQPGGAAQGAARGATPGGALPLMPTTTPPVDEATYRKQVSYMVGLDVGNNLSGMDFPFDMQQMMDGIMDSLKSAKPRLSEAELQATAMRFRDEMMQKQTTRKQQALAKNKQEGDAFLAANKAKEGVQTTPSGLQYKVLKQGQGPSPTSTDVVKFHYKGTYLDGKEFQTSIGGEPATQRVNGLIPGWTEALQKMHVGDRWQLFLPGNLAYGDEPPQSAPFEPGEALIFEVELLEIVKQPGN